MTHPVQPMSFTRQPLDLILSGVGGVRVLRALAAHGGALSVSRLAQETRLSRTGIGEVLASLEGLGLVEMLGSGRSRLHQLRGAHPIAAALKALFDAESARFQAIIDAILAATGDARVVAVWLFGSVARREDTARSDVDVAILADVDRDALDPVADAVRDALAEAGRRLGFHPSVVSLTRADARRLAFERDGLWASLVRDAGCVRGATPRDIARMWNLAGADVEIPA